MNPIPQTIQEPVRSWPEEKKEPEQEIQPLIPYGWEDTKDWSWR